jgi:uncharacterized protein YndB with AHSA1/START domain
VTDIADPQVIEIDTVRWTLYPEGTGTRVILRHSGFDPDDAVQQRSRTIMGDGWVRIASQLGDALNS